MGEFIEEDMLLEDAAELHDLPPGQLTRKRLKRRYERIGNRRREVVDEVAAITAHRFWNICY